MPIKKSFTPSVPRPYWWDEECSAIVKKRKEALSEFKKQGNFINYLQYQNISANVKRTFKLKQKNSWKMFLNKLNKNTPLTEIWNTVRSICNKHHQKRKPQLDESLIQKILDTLAPSSAAGPIFNENMGSFICCTSNF
uniref:Uncharacterized protein LOC114325409 n=1 Tax=Diabrotica virgifera virgifera TaxID=50390 RepID=A0A6P7F320_DIAVI